MIWDIETYMHYKDILGPIAGVYVGHCIPVPVFYLVLLEIGNDFINW